MNPPPSLSSLLPLLFFASCIVLICLFGRWYWKHRHALPAPSHDSIGLIGVRGSAVSTFTRTGHVMVNGELWKATSNRGIIEGGSAVQVVGYSAGLVLVVAPVCAPETLLDEASQGTDEHNKQPT